MRRQLLDVFVLPLVALVLVSGLGVSRAVSASLRADPIVYDAQPHIVDLPPESTTTTAPLPRPKPTPSRSAPRATAPAPVASPDCPYNGDWRHLVSCLWGPYAGQAFSVVACESGGRVDAVGPPTPYGRAVGLFQIMNGPTEPEANVRIAFAKWLRGRWREWVCKPGG